MKRAKVIAELGINHQGSFETLLELTDMAFGAGADYVKLQTRTPELCVPRGQWDKHKLTPWGETMPYIEYRKRMEFSVEQLHAFDSYVKANYPNRDWLTSVWDRDSLLMILAEFSEMPYIKIPSALMTNIDLINGVLNSGHTAIVSTGMSTHEEVVSTLRGICDTGNIIVMLCNSTYPTPDNEVNLSSLKSLRFAAYDTRTKTAPEVGFSSHHVSPFIPIYAAVLGAYMIEVHVTLDRTMPGSDHAASLERAGLELLCREVARIPVVMGDGLIRLYDSEKPAREKLRP